jgi:hypothetical protein
MAVKPLSCLWIVLTDKPVAAPSAPWLIPSSRRRWRTRSPRWVSIECVPSGAARLTGLFFGIGTIREEAQCSLMHPGSDVGRRWASESLPPFWASAIPPGAVVGGKPQGQRPLQVPGVGEGRGVAHPWADMAANWQLNRRA